MTDNPDIKTPAARKMLTIDALEPGWCPLQTVERPYLGMTVMYLHDIDFNENKHDLLCSSHVSYPLLTHVMGLVYA
jgi:predicted SAM-dependent methyltransferase